ncbi:MAG: hypothetical protein ACFCVK_26135 [Acidimicrobiales bacterium]
MLLWFVIVAPVLVAEVFRSPMVDYRIVAAGAALPLVEVALGRPALALHTLAVAVALLTVVMVATTGHRLVRRRLLGLPIGLFVHLVLDGSWADRDLFWWPLFGRSLATVPETGRPLGVLVLLEVAAVAVGWWAWRRYGLAEPEHRRLLVRTGHLAREALT